MGQVNPAAAKAELSALVARAEAGEAIQISRRGKPVAQLTSLRRRRTISASGRCRLSIVMAALGRRCGTFATVRRHFPTGQTR